MNHARDNLARQSADAASRRRALILWQESLNRLLATPVRSPDEVIAKYEALELLRAARP